MLFAGWSVDGPPWEYVFGPWVMVIATLVFYFGAVWLSFSRRRAARATAPPRS